MTSDEYDSQQGRDSEDALVIRNGRYVIEVPNCTSSEDGVQEFVANDAYAASTKPFTVITGINGSGECEDSFVCVALLNQISL